MSGKVRLTGTTDRISLAGQGTRFDNVMLRVGFTNVPYYATGDFQVSDSGVTFNDIAVKDRYDGKGTLTGGILFNHLKDIHMDTKISMEGQCWTHAEHGLRFSQRCRQRSGTSPVGQFPG